MKKIARCPWCYGEPYLFVGNIISRVSCYGIGAKLPYGIEAKLPCGVAGPSRETKDEAIRDWNRIVYIILWLKDVDLSELEIKEAREVILDHYSPWKLIRNKDDIHND